MKRIVVLALLAVFSLLPNLAIAAEKEETKKKEAPKWDVNNPPGPKKSVTIDTTEGTWMSVDVSPDGKEIVFDLLGDLYSMPFDGGEAKALTTGMAWDEQPHFSPNGKYIAYTSDRAGGDNIWIMNRDGSKPQQVTKEDFRLLNSPSWTPDSEFIVARKHFTSTRSAGAGEMWLYHRSGGEGLQLTKRRTEQKDSGEPAFSPDGRYLYFSDDVTPGKFFEYNKDPNGEIYVIQRLDRQTGDVDRYITGPGGSIRPTPSHDGRSLAFIRRIRGRSVIHIADIESGTQTPIYDGLDRDMQETWAIHGVYPTMAWTPDDKAIVFWSGGRINRIDIATRQVTNIPFHVKSARTIAPALRFPVKVAPDQFDVKMLRWVEVAAAGNQVAYEALGHIYIRDLPNGTPHRLTAANDHLEFYPSYSRDGKSVVYTTWDDAKYGTVRIAPANGGEGRVITTKPGHYVEPAFTPDGTNVVYRATSDGYLTTSKYGFNTGIYVVPSAGGESKLVTKKGIEPQFGAANDRVYLMNIDEEEDKRSLFSIKIDSSDQRTLFNSEDATEFRISPDEKWIAFTEQFNAWIAPFVPTGKPVDIGPNSKAMPLTKVSRDAGNYLHWSGDSRTLYWSSGPELYTRELKEAFSFIDGAPEKLPAVPEKGVNISFSQKYDVPSGKVAFVGGRVITMKGDEVIADGTVVVDGNRIIAVGAKGDVQVPADAKVVDTAGKTLMPGIIDVHWHGPMGSEQILPQQNWKLFNSLAFGVTTIHDPSNDTAEIFSSSELAKAGLEVAPRIFSTGTILYGAKAPFKAIINNLDDARSHLRRMKAVGAFSVKSYNQPRREQRQQVIEAARELALMVLPEGGSLFQHNMNMVVDGHTGIEHAIPVAKIYKDVEQLWSGTAVGYTPTIIVGYGGIFGENYWYAHTNVWEDKREMTFAPRELIDARSRRRVISPEEEANHIRIAEVAKKLSDDGVEVQLGAHGQREGLGAHWEMWMMSQGGMSGLQVIRAATLNGAKYLGLDGDIGSIEKGKLADILVLDGNPLENIRNTETVHYTMVNGRLFDAATMDEVGNHPHKRAPFSFQDGTAAGLPAAAFAGDQD